MSRMQLSCHNSRINGRKIVHEWTHHNILWSLTTSDKKHYVNFYSEVLEMIGDNHDLRATTTSCGSYKQKKVRGSKA